MTPILPCSLWIGGAGALTDWRRLHDTGIQAVVHLAYEDQPPPLPRDILLARIPLIDGEGNDDRLIQIAIDTLTRLLGAKFATLVCCQAGRSRSPAIAAAAVGRLSGRPFRDSLAEIAAIHPCEVHSALRAQIAAEEMRNGAIAKQS